MQFSLLFLIAFAFLSFQLQPTHGYRILGFFPSPSKSHLLIHCAITEALAEAGHNVTVVTGMPDVYKNSKYNHIRIGDSIMGTEFIKEMVNNPEPMYKKFPKMIGTFNKMSSDSITHPEMVRFMRDEKDSFDLIIVGYFMNDFHYGLASHFNCPLVVSLMAQPMFTTNKLIGNPSEVAYVPTMLSEVKQPMCFSGRLKNFLSNTLEQNIMGTLLNYHTRKLYKEHFPSDQYPSFDEVSKNVSLVLTNHHHISQGPIRPNVPALIDIGGIQIKEKPDPLPQDIADILDNAKNGVIYFSFGSNVQGSFLSKEKSKIMFDVLSKVPYKVLWKWGDSDFPGTSKNIVYKSWLPQDDILAHPNVKLFITHGGQGSVVESQYHGVPMVGIPLFADQPANMKQVVSSGFGLRLDYLSLTAEDFEKSILEVITNPKYKKAVQRFSTLYRDRPMSARETAVYWIEYVLRHGGAKHLRSPAVDLNSFQLMSLDVIGFLFAVLGGIFWVIVKLCKMCCCCGRKNKGNVKASKTKKNK